MREIIESVSGYLTVEAPCSSKHEHAIYLVRLPVPAQYNEIDFQSELCLNHYFLYRFILKEIILFFSDKKTSFVIYIIFIL